MFTQAITLVAFAASASAHMILNYPTPFGVSTLNSSPLAPADFPCKQRNGVYAVTTMNKWNAGETQTISFNGSAVHSGGSCQFSITTDPEPTKDSQWKVIQSNIGGCPANHAGNYPDIPDPKEPRGPLDHKNPDTFPVKMPSNIPSGRYTFAWTWMNAEGNREFYMNCAPIEVGGSSETASAASAAAVLSKLPDMFVANLPATECSSTAYENFEYPNPGENVVYGAHASNSKTGNTLTGSGCVKQNALGAGSGQIGSPSAGTPSTPSQGTTPSKPSSAPSAPSQPKPSGTAGSPPYKNPSESKIPSNPGGGVFAPGASGAVSAPATGPTAQPNPPAAQPTTLIVKPAPSAAPSTPETPSNNTPTNSECTPCTNDGAVVCIGTKQFGLCNRGCAVAQDLAAGMSCSGGAVVASTKRHLHFPRGHLRRRSAARML